MANLKTKKSAKKNRAADEYDDILRVPRKLGAKITAMAERLGIKRYEAATRMLDLGIRRQAALDAHGAKLNKQKRAKTETKASDKAA